MTGERDGLAAELAVAQNVAAGTQATAEAKDELSNVREATAEGEIKRLEAVVAKMQAEVPKKKPGIRYAGRSHSRSKRRNDDRAADRRCAPSSRDAGA